MRSRSAAPGWAEREQLLERRLADTEQRLEADVAARTEAHERRLAVERSIVAVNRLGELVEVHRAAIEGRHGELQELRRRQSDEVRAIARRLDEARHSRADAERLLDELREARAGSSWTRPRCACACEGAVEALRRDHDIEPEVAMAAALPPLPEGANAPARVRGLERELRLLGPINPLALEEFTELQERHTFLEAQLEDIRTTRRDLLRVIKAVDLEIQTVFAAAFADVSTHFTTLFDTCSPVAPGASCSRPPRTCSTPASRWRPGRSGKSVQEAVAAVGGERSLTALAYLFAVFRSGRRRSTVMDEVEAALDDVNLHRFLGLIHEFRREAAAPRGQPPEADDGGRRQPARRDDAAGRDRRR